MRILGLDEAGRGCVLGPLVVGGFLYETSSEPALAQAALRGAGADDSKALSHKRRVAVRAGLLSLGEPLIRAIPPAAIDDGNLNTLEIGAFLDIIAASKPDHVFLDAPVNPRGIPKLREQLIAASGVHSWTIEPKADSTYPVVGAASIFAKVFRDDAIDAIQAESRANGDGEVGSGYPSDPETRTWLMQFILSGRPFPASVRTRWGTIDILRRAALFPA
jgi:ribonuclease HII